MCVVTYNVFGVLMDKGKALKQHKKAGVADLLKHSSRKSRHSGEMSSGMGGGPLLEAM